MEHARGLAQATAFAPGGKDASGDVNMYSVEGPPGIAPDAIEGMSWALAESVQVGDWDLASQLQDTIYVLKGSKGGFRKGLGKGKSGKGGAAPAAAGTGGAAPAEFQGACRYCNNWGHRMSECRKLTADIASGKAVGKGKAGGKGGPKGGKGPLTAPLAEVAAAATDSWAGDLLDGAVDGLAAAAAELEEWCFNPDSAICSLTADHCDPTGADQVGQLRPADHCDRNGAGRAGPAQPQTTLELDTASASNIPAGVSLHARETTTGKAATSASVSRGSGRAAYSR